MQLQLHLHDLENGEQQNIKKDLSKSSTGADLTFTGVAILNSNLGKPPAEHIELDRVHRVGPAAAATNERPRDVLCRVHFHKIKEDTMHKVWRKGPLLFDGAEITILPELYHCTLHMRSMLKPLLNLIIKCAAMYSWG